jgi:PTS system nitrogen regulatory IIA component
VRIRGGKKKRSSNIMEFRTLLSPGAVALETTPATRKAVLERAAQMLGEATAVPEAEVLQALMAREGEGTTGFGDGTAVPHGRLAATRGAGDADALWALLAGQAKAAA